MSLEKAFDEITEADLRELIDNGISERKNIEYKLILPENKYESKKEFLADISSFANTIGGHILFGIKEGNGIPVELPGISNNDFDSEILRLENLLRDSIQPRIQGISIRKIDVSSGNSILIIRIPQSWSKPHVVNFQGHWRFYARNSAGKYPLDILELKSAFLATTALGERIKNFHFDRISKVSSNEIPVTLLGKARIVFHIIPYSAFANNQQLGLAIPDADIWSVPLIYSSVSGYRHNLDGLMIYSENQNDLFGAYAQIFRNGILEITSGSLFLNNHEKDIPSITLEKELIRSLHGSIKLYKKMSVSPPLVLLISIIGVKGFRLAVSQNLDRWRQHTHLIDRDILILPESIIESFEESPETLLKPIFDSIWNSAGWKKSYGYNDEGEWGKGPNFVR